MSGPDLSFILGAIFASVFIALGLLFYRDLILSKILDLYFKRPVNKNELITKKAFELIINDLENDINTQICDMTTNLNDSSTEMINKVKEDLFKSVIIEMNKQLDVIYKNVDKSIKEYIKKEVNNYENVRSKKN